MGLNEWVGISLLIIRNVCDNFLYTSIHYNFEIIMWLCSLHIKKINVHIKYMLRTICNILFVSRFFIWRAVVKQLFHEETNMILVKSHLIAQRTETIRSRAAIETASWSAQGLHRVRLTLHGAQDVLKTPLKKFLLVNNCSKLLNSRGGYPVTKWIQNDESETKYTDIKQKLLIF